MQIVQNMPNDRAIAKLIGDLIRCLINFEKFMQTKTTADRMPVVLCCARQPELGGTAKRKPGADAREMMRRL